MLGAEQMTTDYDHNLSELLQSSREGFAGLWQNSIGKAEPLRL